MSTSPDTAPILSVNRVSADATTGFELHYGLAGQQWALASSGLFQMIVDGQALSVQTPGLELLRTTQDELRPGCQQLILELVHRELGLQLTHTTLSYPGTALIETSIVVQNIGQQPRTISRIDTIALDLPADQYQLMAFGGSWGWEFEPSTKPLAEDTVLESRSGRSSHGQYPWFALTRAGQSILSGAVAWSGNWTMRFNQRPDHGYTLTGGLHDWEFSTELAPGASFTAPTVVLVLADQPDLNAISAQYSQIGRQFWYPTNPLSARLPVEWNHWWSYEDREINEQAFLENVDVAVQLGIEVCTLDAGWFGPTDPESHWYDYRGDWDLVNSERFPSGIRALADAVHAKGVAFGIWCEIEGLGKDARLAEIHPELVALRDNERLGYVCLGSNVGRAWAYETLERLITEYQADWIKLDFNLDPGAGCNCASHDHGANDGLYAHYQGYYQVLQQIRDAYPHVVLENCSSGGLRIDLGIARQTHMAFLSDPDWPEHSLQCFWGASTFLAPEASLHWSYCEWSLTEHRHQHFNPRDPALRLHQIDFYTRISMLRRFGFSQRLPELPDWVAQRYREHIALYQQHVRRFVGAATLLRLIEQPLREGKGQRWSAFQYSLPDASEHLLAVFRLPGAEAERRIVPIGLDPEQLYTVTWLGDQQQMPMRGADLLRDGLVFSKLPEEGSALIMLQ